MHCNSFQLAVRMGHHSTLKSWSASEVWALTWPTSKCPAPANCCTLARAFPTPSPTSTCHDHQHQAVPGGPPTTALTNALAHTCRSSFAAMTPLPTFAKIAVVCSTSSRSFSLHSHRTNNMRQDNSCLAVLVQACVQCKRGHASCKGRRGPITCAHRVQLQHRAAA